VNRGDGLAVLAMALLVAMLIGAVLLSDPFDPS
jgi:hypothetical protein